MLEITNHKTYRPEDVFLEIVMRPSTMADLGTVKWILGGIAFVCLSLGLAFWAIGAGPVMPFMVIEVALLFAAYRFGVNQGRKMEVLSLSENELIVRKIGRSREAIRMQPYWSTIDLSQEPGQHMQLHLRSKGYYIEVGSLLAPIERQQLADALGRALQKIKGAI